MADSDGEVIYTAYITLRNGRRIYAYQKGLRAFRIVVPRKRPTSGDKP